MKTEIFNFINYHNPEILIKMGISLVLGLTLGLEREMTNKTV